MAGKRKRGNKVRKAQYDMRKNGVITKQHKVSNIKRVLKGLRNKEGFINGLSQELKEKVCG